jgi:putative oxidoreductase
MKSAKKILLRIIGFIFISTGLLKLIHLDSLSIAIFERAHYPIWLFYLTGTFELLGGSLLIIADTRRWGASIIIGIMLGAIVTHIYLQDNVVHLIVPILVILFSGYLIVDSKPEYKQE